MTGLGELIARLEAAEKGSRELDARIIAHLVLGEAEIALTNTEWCVYRGTGRDGKPALWSPNNHERSLPRYTESGPTRSLDAALTLVPEGFYWSIDSAAPQPWPAGACVYRPHCPPWPHKPHTTGKTPAIALLHPPR